MSDDGARTVTRRCGVLTIDETSVRWDANDAVRRSDPTVGTWSTDLKQVNLHAVSTQATDEDADGGLPDGIVGYVLVQIGDDCEEVRLQCKHQTELWAVYNAFSEGVARNSVDDGDDAEAVQSLLGMLEEQANGEEPDADEKR